MRYEGLGMRKRANEQRANQPTNNQQPNSITFTSLKTAHDD